MPENTGLDRTADSTQLRPRHVRTIALAGAVVGVVVLPIAAAQASPPVKNHDALYAAGGQAGADQASATSSPSPGYGVHALTPEFCGVQLTTSTGGGQLRVQACVDQSADSASARVYVANGTSSTQTVALNLTRADGSVVQVQCAIAAGDAEGVCATSPTAISAGSGAYNAIAEIAAQDAPLSAGVVHVESGLVAPARQ